MKKNLFLFLSCLFFLNCSQEHLITTLQDLDISKAPNKVVPIPDDFNEKINEVFTKYTKYTAPNGRPIHIFGQGGVSDEKMARARDILEMYLTPVKNSKYGTAKSFIADSMADRNAALAFFDTQESYEENISKLGLLPFNFQDLYATESHLEGEQNTDRDASYEEILHLTQDYGITPTMPLYQKEIQAASDESVAKNIYKPPEELPKVDYDQEYLATIWDAYLDLWKGKSQKNPEFPYSSREELKAKDPKSYAIIEAFFPKYLTYNAKIDKNFKGIFSIAFDSRKPYTNRSQHLLHATLTGNFNSGLKGNDQNNKLTGNSGNNTLEGGKGNDILDGAAGSSDTAIFSGNESEYTITKNENLTTVKDNTPNRDGEDTLKNIEYLQFKDKIRSL